jgi:Flp pilus assembly pilin Flp
MQAITKWYVKAQNWQQGQTMTEYALIIAAVGVIAFLGYQTMGTTITTLLGTIDTSL